MDRLPLFHRSTVLGGRLARFAQRLKADAAERGRAARISDIVEELSRAILPGEGQRMRARRLPADVERRQRGRPRSSFSAPAPLDPMTSSGPVTG